MTKTKIIAIFLAGMAVRDLIGHLWLQWSGLLPLAFPGGLMLDSHLNKWAIFGNIILATLLIYFALFRRENSPTKIF